MKNEITEKMKNNAKKMVDDIEVLFVKEYFDIIYKILEVAGSRAFYFEDEEVEAIFYSFVKSFFNHIKNDKDLKSLENEAKDIIFEKISDYNKGGLIISDYWEDGLSERFIDLKNKIINIIIDKNYPERVYTVFNIMKDGYKFDKYYKRIEKYGNFNLKEKKSEYIVSKNEFWFKKSGELFLGNSIVDFFSVGSNCYKILDLLFYNRDFLERQKGEEYITMEELCNNMEGHINIAKCVDEINRRVIKKCDKCTQNLIGKDKSCKKRGNVYRLNIFINV